MKPNDYKITRKDFLKLMGVVGASISVPPTKFAEDVVANPALSFADQAGRPKRPWWVKKVDEPTTEIYWDHKQRFDAREAASYSLSTYIGTDEYQLLKERGDRIELEHIKQNTPGFKFVEHVLNDAFRIDIYNNGSLLGPKVKAPQERGVGKWVGILDEAARIIRVAMRQFGAAQVGFVKLDENTKKLIHAIDKDGKRIEFEDVDLAYETEEKRVIPNRAQWVIAYTLRMPVENMKHAPSVITSLSTMSGYSRSRYIQNHTQAFIWGLGYQCIGQVIPNGLGVSNAFSVLAGHGEMSRLNRVITPEYGPMVQTFFMITDLPVAVDKPINAGIMEFCKVCKKCAESCPSAALSKEDEPSWEPTGGWNNPGHRAYFENAVNCRIYWEEIGSNCSICFSICPYSKKDKAWIHTWVKAGIATVPLLDGFFRSMDDAMSYGAQKSVDEWWYLDLPEFGLDLDERKG